MVLRLEPCTMPGDRAVVGVEDLSVAKKRSMMPVSKPVPETERKAVVLTMRGNPEWKTWLKQLSKHCHLKVSVCVEQALMEYAERRAFAEVPPDRTE
jgi:hypothetical protein